MCVYHQAFKRLNVQLHLLLLDICSLFVDAHFLAKEKGDKVQRASSKGTPRWMHHGLAEIQSWAGGKDQGKTRMALVGKFRAISWKPVRCHLMYSLLVPLAAARIGWEECGWEPQASRFSGWATVGPVVPILTCCFGVTQAWLGGGLWHEICSVVVSSTGTGFPKQLCSVTQALQVSVALPWQHRKSWSLP